MSLISAESVFRGVFSRWSSVPLNERNIFFVPKLFVSSCRGDKVKTSLGTPSSMWPCGISRKFQGIWWNWGKLEEIREISGKFCGVLSGENKPGLSTHTPLIKGVEVHPLN